jgi:DNA mismatch repair protein MutL
LSDIIQLLPDNIANQIAAGEVIQRPASAVKELLENAIDAAATQIQLTVVDAGKSLIAVTDNGKGMSETDARMAFERHATSKIKKIEDLFAITTMGFRGEALASIAAVAQVELKTKQANNDVGTYIEIENSKVLKQEPCATANGTTISMKNLFFNVPARRNFLKSNAAEMRHIIEEFIRVAMAFPQIMFTLTSNGQQVYYLEPGNIKQRVVQILGSSYNAKLVAVNEKTDYVNIYGFVGKPETAKKTRGDQYFFVNNRFIKSAYLNHAVNSAFEGILAKDSFPGYVLFIDLDPAQIDINVHPTKQEIKFEDEKIVYAFVQAAIKHALAQFSIAPSLDFSLNADIQQLEAISKPFTAEKQTAIAGSNLYKTFTDKHQAHKIDPQTKSNLSTWKDFLKPAEQDATSYFEYEKNDVSVPSQQNLLYKNILQQPAVYFQLQLTYILAPNNNGFMLVHQQHAHERILYEKYSKLSLNQQPVTQKSLFPVAIELTTADAVLLEDLMQEVTAIGYVLEQTDNNTFIIQGTPADVLQGNEKHSLELLLEQFKHFSSDIKYSKREKLIRCISRQQAIKTGTSLTQPEMKELLEQLFNCNTPNTTPSGNPTFIEFTANYLDSLFGKLH